MRSRRGDTQRHLFNDGSRVTLWCHQATPSEDVMSDKIQTRFWGRQIDDVMSEIVRQAAICQVKLLDPGVIDAVVHDNPSVCGNNNPKSFKKLRELLMMGLMMRDKAV